MLLRDGLDLLDRSCISLCQTLVDHRSHLPHTLRYLLTGSAAVILDLLGHILRRQETAVIHIHSGGEAALLLGHAAELGEGIGIIQLMAHRLDHPQTHDVLKETEAILIAALIGKVRFPALLRADGHGIFHAHQ